jgi:cytidylate kinase
LGLTFLDTGAMYRAVTLAVLERHVSPDDADGCAAVARGLALDFDEAGLVRIDGRSGEPEIRGARVTGQVSVVSAHPGVRAAVVARQRELASRPPGVVAEGRDTTTVVFPDAGHKFFLTASPAERARRRAAQEGRDGRPEAVDAIRRDIERRDRLDETRAHSPLVQAPDAVRIETDALDVDATVAAVLAAIRPNGRRGGPAVPRERERKDEVTEAELARARTAELLTEKTLVYRAARRFFWLWFVFLCRVRVRGRAHVPPTGGCLIVANHQSYFDIPLVAAALQRHVCFVARDTLAKSRGIAFLIKWCGGVMVRRGASDRASIRAIVEHLAKGDAVCIFPEGTRSNDGAMLEFKRGMALIARQAGVPVVPAGIRGTLRTFGRGMKVPRPARCSIEFGAPLEPTADVLDRARVAVSALARDGLFGG